ncbi:MAG: hypothetical protein LBQ22_08300 [Bacteroidales bacterium]|jgi:hypothetical protein|nr:hypothetical protein [Bacteroidales bacterium]
MKKLLVFLFLVLIFNSLWSQEKFLEYKNFYQNFTYDIFIDKDRKSGDFTLVFYANPVNAKDTVGFFITRNEYNNFFTSLTKARDKYDEWIKVAEEYKVMSYTRKMKMFFDAAGFFFVNKDIHSFYPVTVSFNFTIQESNDKKHAIYILSLESVPYASSKDQMLSTEGFSIQFYSLDDLNSFVDAISIDKINEYTPMPTLDELFQD